MLYLTFYYKELETIYEKFCMDHDLNKLKRESKNLIDKYNKPANFDRLTGTQNAVNGLKMEIGQNIDKLISQQGDIEDLEGQTAALKDGAGQFEKNSKSVEREMFWRKVKYTAIIVAIIVIIVVIIVLCIKL